MSNLRIRLTEEVRHMPVMVRPEDIKLPKRRLKKDILYRLGLKEGEQISFEEGLGDYFLKMLTNEDKCCILFLSF